MPSPSVAGGVRITLVEVYVQQANKLSVIACEKEEKGGNFVIHTVICNLRGAHTISIAADRNTGE